MFGEGLQLVIKLPLLPQHLYLPRLTHLIIPNVPLPPLPLHIILMVRLLKHLRLINVQRGQAFSYKIVILFNFNPITTLTPTILLIPTPHTPLLQTLLSPYQTRQLRIAISIALSFHPIRAGFEVGGGLIAPVFV